MTLQEALEIARQAKPKQPDRTPMDKLRGSAAAAQLSARVDALNKRYDTMGSTVVGMQKQLDHVRADVALCASVMKITISTETMQ